MKGSNHPKKANSIRNEFPISQSDFEALSQFIQKNYGIQLTEKKKTLLESRLQKRLKALNIRSFQEYVDVVLKKGDNIEVIQMIDAVSTNKTEFFRENMHFSLLKDIVFPTLTTKSQKPIRIWSAAASSGEEVYSIAMSTQEYLDNNGLDVPYSILATDISYQMLNQGIRAVYTGKRVENIPRYLKKKYLLKSKNPVNDTVRVVKELRSKVIFKRLNLMGTFDEINEAFDIIFCRNVLIYFDRKTQEQVIRKLCSKLKKDGYLFVGHAETVIGFDVPLTAIAHAAYQKV
ncbi:MAG: CheR family methyltransferase [Flammeovirgaceae bacterium]